MKRCNCNSGECGKCLLDEIDELLKKEPEYRMCTCDSIWCFICQYYKKKLTNVYEYLQFIKGTCVAIRFVTARNRYEAVSILSNKYNGVFKLKSCEVL